VQLILFDIDGTLLLNGPLPSRLFFECFENATGQPVPEQKPRFNGRTDRAIFRGMLEDQSDFDRRFSTFSTCFIARMRATYPSATGPRLLPGSRELVERWADRTDLALAAGTGNLRETAKVKLGRFGLDRYLEAGGFGGDHEDRTDLLRAAIEEASARYGVDFDPREVWVIGDTDHDIHAAHALGARCLAVGTGGESGGDLREADVYFDDLSDLAGIERAIGVAPA